MDSNLSKLEQIENPFAFFTSWFHEAVESEINDPGAMTVASVDSQGMPNIRTVLLRQFDEENGFIFYTNFESTKGEELLSSGKAALCIHWKSLRKQVRVRGNIEEVETAMADAYFAKRPRGSQIGCYASDQSRILTNRKTFEERIEAAKKRFENVEKIPRPSHWSGFRIIPASIEFWMDGEYRLHDRILVTKKGNVWRSQRLFP